MNQKGILENPKLLFYQFFSIWIPEILDVQYWEFPVSLFTVGIFASTFCFRVKLEKAGLTSVLECNYIVVCSPNLSEEVIRTSRDFNNQLT